MKEEKKSTQTHQDERRKSFEGPCLYYNLNSYQKTEIASYIRSPHYFSSVKLKKKKRRIGTKYRQTKVTF